MKLRRAVGRNLAIAAGLSLAAAGTAWAQAADGAPQPLFPGFGVPQQAAQVPAVAPKDVAPSGITFAPLADISPETVGILHRDAAEPWDRDLGAHLWQGSTPARVIDRLHALPAAAFSPAARGLARQLLLSSAAPSASGDGAVAAGAYTAARLQALLAAGQAESVVALAAAVPRTVRGEPVDLALVDAAWMSGDLAAACGQADDGQNRYGSPVWLKMQAVCAARAGDTEKARLNVGLLEELGAADAAFHSVIDRVLGRGKISLPSLPDGIGPFEVAALTGAGASLPEDLPFAAKPWLARMAIPAAGPINDGRLAIAETGLRSGVLSADAAAAVLSRAAFSKADLDAARNLKADAGKPRGRALYWQVLKTVDVPAARAEIIGRMLAAARPDAASRAVVAALLAKPLADLSADPAAAWLAGDAVRAALWNGDWAAASRWLTLASQNAGASEDSRDSVESLRPLMRIVAAPAAAADRASQPAPSLADWAKARVAHGMAAEDAARLRDRLIGISRALGLSVRDADWQAALAAPSAGIDGVSPPPVLLAAAEDAAAHNQIGVTLALVSQAAATAPDLGSLSPAAAERLIAVLLKVGATDWAKRFAAETLLAAGY